MEQQHTPVGRYEWEKLILRAELDSATKLVALAAATYGNPDGTRVGPSVPRLAAELEWSEKHVQNQLSTLRKLGLLKEVRRHSAGHPTVYRLTFPAAGFDELPMRTDVDGYPWIGPRLPGRGGRKPTLTGTGVPVTQNPDRNSSSPQAAPEEPPTRTPVPVTQRSPELEFHLTGTPVPPDQNSSSPDHIDQTKTTPMAHNNSTPTSAEQDPEEANMNQPSGPGRPDPEAAYRTARRILDAARQYDPDALSRAFAQAARELSDRGIVGVRPRTILAAELLTRWAAREPATAQEGP